MAKNNELTNYNYNEYDKLSVTLNSIITEEILVCYRSLGWVQADRKEDGQFGNVEHFDFYRSHNIAHKDRLQLLQVYMESEVNALSGINANKHVRSLLVALILGFFSLALLIYGIIFACVVKNAFAVGLGIFASVLGLAVCGITFFGVFKIVRWENSFYEKSIKSGLAMIEKVYREACSLTGIYGTESGVKEKFSPKQLYLGADIFSDVNDGANDGTNDIKAATAKVNSIAENLVENIVENIEKADKEGVIGQEDLASEQAGAASESAVGVASERETGVDDE